MDKTKMNFIKTTDMETADTLRSLGFQEIGRNSGYYLFANCQALTFEGTNIDLKKVAYTNVYTAT